MCIFKPRHIPATVAAMLTLGACATPQLKRDVQLQQSGNPAEPPYLTRETFTADGYEGALSRATCRFPRKPAPAEVPAKCR